VPSIEEMDVDGNGLISRQEFEDTMGDERHLLARAAKNGGFILFLVILVRLQGFFFCFTSKVFLDIILYYIMLYYIHIFYTHIHFACVFACVILPFFLSLDRVG
jgi:hypothetical protein